VSFPRLLKKRIEQVLLFALDYVGGILYRAQSIQTHYVILNSRDVIDLWLVIVWPQELFES